MPEVLPGDVSAITAPSFPYTEIFRSTEPPSAKPNWGVREATG